ncbi:hypothetical protein [Teredinibacter haidensis]|uniref:hypothetical protein n=1 Tax=Teredinibacter haidensis TaxID=2731755 RepID=UPI0009489F1A|nr:hypothetical protein [Teredinibacter haidensis]
MKCVKQIVAFAISLVSISSLHAEDIDHYTTAVEAGTHEIFMPPNQLHLRSNAGGSDIDEALFDEIIDEIYDYYTTIVSSHGAVLNTVREWDNNTVNAQAYQSGNNWFIRMYGGLARAPEVTPDGFALVVCHEMGHHLAGFPFKGARWAASEGQSDYFATQSCARQLWLYDDNSEYEHSAPQTVKNECNARWNTTFEQQLCYRTALAGKSLADLLAASRGVAVHFDTPDQGKVDKTYINHPAPQCRLDTYFAGSLCTMDLDPFFIPGKNAVLGRESMYAEMESAYHYCASISADLDVINYNDAHRPRCWFKPKLKAADVPDLYY